MNAQMVAGQSIPLTPDGNWLYVKSAQAEIEIYRQLTGEHVKLSQSSVFNVGEGKSLGRLIIISRSDNEIELQFGYGSFTPPVEGQGVVVQSLPSITVEQLPDVVVKALPAVQIAANQQLAVSHLPPLHLVSLPPIDFNGVQNVNIKALPAVTLEASQVVRVTEEVSENLVTEAVSAFPHNIAANAQRKAITIKASKANVESVFVDAFELEAGERIEIGSTAAMTITGAAGDKITLMEI
ncbi:hypothetical protein HYN73_00760 [Vibrio parahaemolyticus]|uniref:hypothetical protein n=1 Tax=Vibrio parahaemolyticus TaxID=670 RepID=UPI0004D85548|nr:hypothetical protein [Vibrio parahaemolyticus]EGR1699936.1 hypothetical protein [Vibrio parahaemolyticus]MBM5189599.1 hypothetical protein [Vibrio parahaemolyticus]MBM5201922.1 hypothetical protein [Vibrio parahaemolyticus]MBM5206384.1 hypothetical protein [Vibrio parahaemolyticus]MBM5207747.1 hypothetical protein [Vibrio parahaemolyticus]